MSRVAGVVPAAGRSTRMGRPKALLDAGGGRTFVERVAATLARGGCTPVVVVVRDPAGEAGTLARRVGARVVANPEPAGGLVASVRAALRALPSPVGGIAVLPVDHPLVDPATVEELLAAFDGAAWDAAVPVHAGRRGHPVVLGRALFRALLDEEMADGISALLERDPGRVREVPVEDEGVLADIDTPDAYRRWLPAAAG